MQFGSIALMERLGEGVTVVTPSRLTASLVSHNFAQRQLHTGLASWPRPAIHSIDSWLMNCWLEVRYAHPEIPALLSPLQERLLWRHIIEEEHPELFDADAAARLAIEASSAIAEWNISTDEKDWQSEADSEQFHRLLTQFRQKCRAENWSSRGDFWSLLPRCICDISDHAARTLFFGFETISPALRRTVEMLRGRASIEPVAFGSPKKNVPGKLFASFEAEIEDAARWARYIFEEQPGRSIGVFVPNLSVNRGVVERAFQQVFYPSVGLHNQSARLRSSGEDSVLHINVLSRLDKHPLAANARLILELARPRLASADASAILRCPCFTGAAEERSARALADLELRKQRDLDVTLHDLEFASRNCPLLTKVWARVRSVLRGHSQRLELAAWSELFGDLLSATGWPGSWHLTAQEQQIVESWKDSLSNLASLGLVVRQVPLEFALLHLNDILASRGWERGDWFSPVQIVDASDASGFSFDFARITGLSVETWPQPVRPLPFIPLALQRKNQLPGSDPQKVRCERERKTDALFRSADEITATFSGQLAPIARKYLRVTKREIPVWKDTLPRESFALATLDIIDDSCAPAFRSSEAAYGGTGILKAQSLCPFRSFAENRLRALRPEDACFGFDARDRGSFLHAAMEEVWKELRTLKRLRTLDRDQLQQLVRSAVMRAVKDDESSPLYQLSSETERHRLEELILDWLEIEKNRRHPFTAEHVEERRAFEIGGLHLRLRVDRIDRLENGGLVLIDYKSGEQKIKNLDGSRPSEPQLLVYAAALEENVEGVFFAQMKPRDLKAVGFSRTEHFPAKSKQYGSVRGDWDDYLAQSRAAVEKLASDFVAGNAVVDPLPDACTWCNQKPLCRILEQSSTEDEENGD